MAANPGFQLASELGPSLSREGALENLIRVQAAQLDAFREAEAKSIDRSEAAMNPGEKQALVQLLSDLSKRIEDLEKLTGKQGREIEDLSKALNEAEQDIEEIREHFPALVSEAKKRISAIESHGKPKPTANNADRINALADALLCRAKAGQRGVTYAEAAKILGVNKARICQLRSLIAADHRFDVSWHPKKKNTKVICLKNYK
jgi:uncharacterized coiled-coil protein SlyX